MKIKLINLAICLFSIACTKESDSKKRVKMEIVDKYNKKDYSTLDQNHPDAKVIAQLVKAGSDLKKIHTPDFQFDFKELEDARTVAKILLEKGFSSKIYAPQKGFPTYELVAKKKMIINFKSITGLTEPLRKIAKDHNGVMSGWGSPVEK